MQTVKWLTFCISNAVTRSIVHFFPSSAGVAAPYAAECSLSLFGRDIAPKNVVLEGARFGQPDGVRLDDVFPQLQEGTSGFFGVEFGLQTTQPRTDLQTSSCIIELSSRGHSCRFRPRQLIEIDASQALPLPSTSRTEGPVLGIKDAFNTSSLVVVNSTTEAYTPKILARSSLSVQESEPHMLALDALLPQTVAEFDLGEQFVPTDSSPRECSWGLLRAGGLWPAETIPKGVVMYMMYRDVVTRRPVSVCMV